MQFDDEVILVLCVLVIEAIILVALAFVFLDDNWVFSWFYGKRLRCANVHVERA
jgi:hypothetical protein